MDDKVLIVVLILLIVGLLAGLLTKIAADESKKYIWVHTKTGNRYRIIQECKMKYDGKWMDAIAYISEKDNEMYVREYNDFVLNFKRLSEWKKDWLEDTKLLKKRKKIM